MLEALAAERGAELEASSAGLLAGERVPPQEMLTAAAAAGVDLAQHKSRAIDRAAVSDADLVLGMEKAHVREVVVLDPEAWPRTFCLRDLVLRSSKAPQTFYSETLAEWVGRLGQDRRPSDMLGDDPSGDDPAGDVPDPMGGPPEAYEEAVQELTELVTRLFEGLQKLDA